MNKSLKIVLMGYGKMGKAIENIALSRGHKMVQVFSSKSPATSPDAIPAADIIIEFTRPETAYKNLELSIKSGTPVITGTTGWLERLNEIEILCAERDGTFLYSSNFSIGMNVFFEINQLLARLMNKTGDYRASMEERHHITKKGQTETVQTVTLAQQIINESSGLSNWTLEQGQTNTELL